MRYVVKEFLKVNFDLDVDEQTTEMEPDADDDDDLQKYLARNGAHVTGKTSAEDTADGAEQ